MTQHRVSTTAPVFTSGVVEEFGSIVETARLPEGCLPPWHFQADVLLAGCKALSPGFRAALESNANAFQHGSVYEGEDVGVTVQHHK